MRWSEPGIGEHAFLSDCGTAALVTRHGEIDWLCAPRFDSPPLLWSLLDRDRGGAWDLTVENAAVTASRYVDDSLVLETVWEGDGGTVRCQDSLAVRQQGDGLEPIGALVRFVTCVDGRALVRSRLRARPEVGRASARWVAAGGGALRERGGLVLSGGLEPEVDGAGDPAYRVELTAGDTAAIVLDHGGAERRYNTEQARALVDSTCAAWRAWADRTSYDGNGAHHVRRSAAVLRGLLHEETGGMIAAPTTSLPEWPGGARNWDYRYVWHRDAPLVVLAFLRLGHAHEARSYLRYLMNVTDGSMDRLTPVHGIDGTRPPREVELDGVAGYAGSRPVRVGNDAGGQHQLDVYGHVLDAMLTYQQAVGGLPDTAVRRSYAVVEVARGIWREPDAGPWEIRGELQHWTSSKVYAWVCLDRGIQLVRQLGREEEVPLRDWCRDRDAIHADVLRRGYDTTSGTFAQFYGAPRTDGSLLRLPLLGFLHGQDPRVVRTIDRIIDELGTRDPLVHRYDPAATDDGLDTPEGAFLMCSFDLVSALILAGRNEEAQRRFRELCGSGNDLGLFAEEMTDGGTMLGNFPQAFTHLALIEAAVNLHEADNAEALHDWARRRSTPASGAR